MPRNDQVTRQWFLFHKVDGPRGATLKQLAAFLPEGEGHSDFAVSRAYYAMFYAAQALLLTRDVRRTKHSGIIAAFNELVVHSGELPHELFLLLRDAFEDRAEGDYGLTMISEEQRVRTLQAGVSLCKR